MEYRHTIEIVVNEIKELEDFVSNFKNHERIPQIEIDLVLSKVRNLYDLLLMLNDTPGKNTVQPSQSAQVKDKNKSDSASTRLINQPVDESIPPDNPREEIIIENEYSEKARPPKEPDTKPGSRDYEIIADRYQDSRQFINEALARNTSGQDRKDLSTVMQAKPIKSIESAIGLNEKFLFIKELFNGDAETYSKTIEILNISANFNEAFNYIHENFEWDMESLSAQKILDLVRRKHIVNQNG